MRQNISDTFSEEFDVSDVSNFSKFGSIVEIGNIPWKLCVRWETKDNVEYLAIFVYCGSKSNLWGCKARVGYWLDKEFGYATYKEDTVCYNKDHLNWGNSWFIRKSDLILPSNGYVTDGKFEISVEVEILESVGFHEMGITDFSIARNLDTEIELIVGDRKLYVDKLPLMCCSSVFRETESAGNRDARTIEYNAIFETFLAILYDIRNHKITDSNVDALLKLAEQYDVEFLTAHGEDFLISSKTISTVEKLRLSEVYKLSELQTKVFKKLRRTELRKLKREVTKNGSVLTTEALLVKIDETRLTFDAFFEENLGLPSAYVSLIPFAYYLVSFFVFLILLDVFLGPGYEALASSLSYAGTVFFYIKSPPYFERFLGFDD